MRMSVELAKAVADNKRKDMFIEQLREARVQHRAEFMRYVEDVKYTHIPHTRHSAGNYY